jgi:hypothetical protein
VPQNVGVCTQYKEVYLNGTIISIHSSDSYVCLAGNIVLVQDIISGSGQVHFVCKIFCDVSNFFTYPLDSSILGIHVVSNLTQDSFDAHREL